MISAITACTFISCLWISPVENIDIHIDDNMMNETWISIVVNAGAKWQAAVPIHFTLTEEDCPAGDGPWICIGLMKENDLMNAINFNNSNGSVLLGITSYCLWPQRTAMKAARISIAYDAVNSLNEYEWLPISVMAHELGHAMRLRHNNYVSTIMTSDAYYGSHGIITESDIRQWWNIYGSQPIINQL
jgi:hypothetical protein